MSSSPRDASIRALASQAEAGNTYAIARLISLIENRSPNIREIAELFANRSGQAAVIGLTGPPGVGKSTLTSALIAQLRANDKRVGVLAVDPSSQFSGGALLGDRIRMHRHATDDGVFIRSMGSRGHAGGLAAAVPQALRVLDGVGFDAILIETVGVGQLEFEITGLADTTVLILAPGFGDGVQAAKAGILEIADIFVINKADRDGASDVTRDLRQMQTLMAERPDSWLAPILKTVASDGTGIVEVASALTAHRAWLTSGEGLAQRKLRRATAEIEMIALGKIQDRFERFRGSNALEGFATAVLAGRTDPYAAADDLIASL